jgi:hypothetical protein
MVRTVLKSRVDSQDINGTSEYGQCTEMAYHWNRVTFKHLDRRRYLPRIMRRALCRRRNLLVLFILATGTASLLAEFSNSLLAYWNCDSEQTSPTPSVHFVLATVTWNDLEWIEHLRVPNLEIIPYVANDPKAKCHPPANRGIKAMLHLTYLYEFYDTFPDITIFKHGSDWSWHIGGTIQYCTAYAIEHLDLDEVRRRKCLNMHEYAGKLAERVSKLDQHLSHDKIWRLWSEAVARRAIYEHCVWEEFLRWSCSSNSCVAMLLLICSHERSHSIKFENLYKMQLDWLQSTQLGNEVSGRIWEHMWQYFFIKKANN